ncbi:hypothetical protein [Streptomyces sp. NPDC021969]|uniref:hypothetical protein n=1 Tax=unclassified Streptomyces TaxID=2593676 RepID=UPI0033E7ADDE
MPDATGKRSTPTEPGTAVGPGTTAGPGIPAEPGTPTGPGTPAGPGTPTGSGATAGSATPAEPGTTAGLRTPPEPGTSPEPGATTQSSTATESGVTAGAGPKAGSAGGPSDVPVGARSLLPPGESDRLGERLHQAVAGFVDAPRASVEEADRVLEEIAARFADAVAHRRRTLRTSWHEAGGDKDAPSTDTEQLRLALRDYRELADQLMHR